MTRLVNDPVEFSAELVDGFIQANTRYVRPVYGGVVRSTETKPGKVAIVTGGGLGHYPGFVGWVGPGLVDGAVTGKVFASPAASQVHSPLLITQRSSLHCPMFRDDWPKRTCSGSAPG